MIHENSMIWNGLTHIITYESLQSQKLTAVGKDHEGNRYRTGDGRQTFPQLNAYIERQHNGGGTKPFLPPRKRKDTTLSSRMREITN